MPKRDFWFIIKSFFIWRIVITIIAILAIKYIPTYSINFFGGKYINYVTNPLFWGWANFDGEHYLSIAINGYRDLQLAFFPAYPILMRLLTQSSDPLLNVWSGLIISNTSFFLSLVLLWKIVKLDYPSKIAKLTILLLLIFPTSFYFGAVYTESLYLFSSLLTYYLYRKNKYLLAGLVGILMTLTRIYGVLVLIMILINIMKNKIDLVKIIKEKVYLVGIAVIGIFSYMWFCWASYGNAFAFYSLQTNVGEHRSNHLILLPQVFYRYFVKILPNLTWNFYSGTFTSIIEVIIAIIFLMIIIFSFKKIRWDYWIYIMLGYLVPTLTGSFSSLPRYVVILFPAFIYIAKILENKSKYLRLGIYLVLVILTTIAEIMFFRGYFVS